MLSFLTAQWKPIALGLATAALIIFGMKVQGWRQDSHDLAAAKSALRAAIEAQVKADAARASFERQLKDAHGKIETQIKEVVKRVKVVVHDRSDCDFSPSAVRLLNDARSGKLPETPGGAPEPSVPSSPDGRVAP